MQFKIGYKYTKYNERIISYYGTGNKKIFINLLTGILNFAIIIFFTHAVFEHGVNLIIFQCLAYNWSKIVFIFVYKYLAEKPFSLIKLCDYLPKAKRAWFNSASNMNPFSFLSYNFRHSRKSS